MSEHAEPKVWLDLGDGEQEMFATEGLYAMVEKYNQLAMARQPRTQLPMVEMNGLKLSHESFLQTVCDVVTNNHEQLIQVSESIERLSSDTSRLSRSIGDLAEAEQDRLDMLMQTLNQRIDAMANMLDRLATRVEILAQPREAEIVHSDKTKSTIRIKGADEVSFKPTT